MDKITISEFRANISHYKGLIQAGARIRVTEHGKTAFIAAPPSDDAAGAQKWLKSIAPSTRIKDVESPLTEAWNAEDDTDHL